ncbi:YraN family protein [Vibrio sp. 10N.286.49.B3]|uniref:YraN family protein n=1 Tax=Vibrio sp. 10N.286.49.B3 TaxID=1880855 RepID=UPI000C823070|nr:YraN family protein [Vibrio sp. 10N.286.49.B3]PMH39795.1 YraN family protein [Vibrio sp. 10N.286.49.B3]
MGLFSRTKQAQHTRQIGNQYETLAEQYLARQGLILLKRNFIAKCGEIDLIMRDTNTLVFIEVKYRKHTQYGHAAQAVNAKKRQRLINTAQLWLIKNNLSVHSTDFRFDVMAIHDSGKEIEWIKNAITQG